MMTSALSITGLTNSAIPPDGHLPSQDLASKLVVVMVGLPARGKSYIVKKLARYLNWLQHRTRTFNAGQRRRINLEAPKQGVSQVSAYSTTSILSPATFFDPNNPQFVTCRDKIALDTLDELLDWLLHEGGTVGILDATNSTPERRQLVISHIRNKAGTELGVLFLESCCFDKEILEGNFKLKLSGPDYYSQDPEQALADFHQRVALYEKSYVPLGEAEEAQMLSFVQLVDVGRKLNTHLIRGFLATGIVEYLLNFNLTERQIWITCNGESLDDVNGRIGRDSNLSDSGRHYAIDLPCFIQRQREIWENDRQARLRAKVATRNGRSQSKENVPLGQGFCIWTSMMSQAVQTVEKFPPISYAKKEMKILDDMNAGTMAGLTFDEIRSRFPLEFEHRSSNKLHYRWPGLGGEGYVDVINRLRPIILEVERMRDHLLLVTHRAIVRVLLGYFLGLQRDELAGLEVLKHAVFCFEPVSTLTGAV
jgi:6-phosphofructo-2-kinase